MTRRRSRTALAAVAALVAGALLGGPGACRRDAGRARVLVLALDGLDPATVDLLLSEGKLPSFARLRQDGAYGRLASTKPLLSPILWTTIATGKTPEQHGIGHFVAENALTGERLPVTSRTRRTKAIWNVFSDLGRTVAVVGWWATWPAEAVNGWIVSDHTAYHFLFEDGFTGGAEAPEASGKTHPPGFGREIAPLVRRPGSLTFEDFAPFVRIAPADLERPFSFEDDLSHFRWALATAKSYRAIGLDLWRRHRPDLALVYVEGTDSSAHLFGHLFRRDDLAGELAVQQARYGGTVEAMYAYADEILGDHLAAMDDDTTLVVLSDHGFELGALPDDPSTTRNMRRVSAKFHRETGILYLYGPKIARHARLEAPTLVDVAPTLLALAGLPAAADMPGRVLTEAFREPPSAERVPTYETAPAPGTPPAAADAAGEAAMMQHLEALGYIETETREGDTNLASIHFEAGRFEEAERLYRRVLAQDPENPYLHTSLAGALGAQGKYDEAKRALERALALDPLNPEAHHNLAVIHERLGDRAQALAQYRTALRYAPQYEPSRQALLRLTGRADVQAPRDEAEARAAVLAERAADAAKRGAYPEARALLDEAAAIAPRYALVHQYRANVAYLMGDRPAAIAALERALDEPDNALFRENLRQLRAAAGG